MSSLYENGFVFWSHNKHASPFTNETPVRFFLVGQKEARYRCGIQAQRHWLRGRYEKFNYCPVMFTVMYTVKVYSVSVTQLAGLGLRIDTFTYSLVCDVFSYIWPTLHVLLAFHMYVQEPI